MKRALLLENVRMALSSIRSQMLRAVLTILIIAIGIGALVGILTAIDVMKEGITGNFTSMGANTFNIRNRSSGIRFGGGQRRVYDAISWFQAERFKKEFPSMAKVSVTCTATWNATARSGSLKSNPNIIITGGDENFMATSGYELEEGRGFSQQELLSGTNVVIIGHELKQRFFSGKSCIDKIISLGPVKYKVIGSLKEKGSSFGFSGDKIALLPVKNVKHQFAPPGMSYVINILALSPDMLERTIEEAIGFFRVIRGLRVRELDNFEITKSDSLSVMLIDNLKYVSIAATVIAVITLLGAAIGLMNIMLVSVTERTREIGVRKAIGATSASIRNQFLTEAVLICQIGGIAGILFGMLIGNLLSLSFNLGLILPWLWIVVAAIVCFVVGLLSGIIPAIKASRLDPIEALRFE
jgi:putative ABC transport system permease protein